MLNAVRNYFKPAEVETRFPVPDQEWFENTGFQHTPDVARLQRRAHWLYMAYFHVDERNPFRISTAYTRGRYTLWKKNLGSNTYPVLLEPTKLLNTRPEVVRGHLMRMPTDALIKLDETTENGVQFIRKRITVAVNERIYVPDVRDRASFEELFKDNSPLHHKNELVSVLQPRLIKAWVHVGIPDYWLPMAQIRSKIKTTNASVNREDSGVFVTEDNSRRVNNSHIREGYLLSLVNRYEPTHLRRFPYYMYNILKEQDG